MPLAETRSSFFMRLGAPVARTARVTSSSGGILSASTTDQTLDLSTYPLCRLFVGARKMDKLRHNGPLLVREGRHCVGARKPASCVEDENEGVGGPLAG